MCLSELAPMSLPGTSGSMMWGAVVSSAQLLWSFFCLLDGALMDFRSVWHEKGWSDCLHFLVRQI